METRFSRFSRNARHHVLCLFIYLFSRLDSRVPREMDSPRPAWPSGPRSRPLPADGREERGAPGSTAPPGCERPTPCSPEGFMFPGSVGCTNRGRCPRHLPPALQRARLRRQPAHRDTGGRWPKRGDRGRHLSPGPAAPPAGVCPGFPLLPPFHLSLLSAEFFGKSLV